MFGVCLESGNIKETTIEFETIQIQIFNKINVLMA